MKNPLLTILILLFGFSVLAQTYLPGNQPAFTPLNDFPEQVSAPVSSVLTAAPPAMGEVPPELAAALQNALDSLAAVYGSVGLSAALLLPGDDLWKGTSGINSAVPGDTLSTEMRMGMGSVTKTFTGTAIMQLVEEGVLTLEDTIGQWLPSYPNVHPSITLRHLLNHTSGIYNYTDNPLLWDQIVIYPDSIFTPTSVLENYVLGPVFPTGATWGYSNTNYVLLGLIIEAATGQAFHEVIRNRFLGPQELTTMSLHPNETPTGPVAHLWTDLNGDSVADDYTAAGISLNSLFSMVWTAGALMATPGDLVYWIKDLMTGQVVSQNTLDQMMETVPAVGNLSYGLSLMKIDVLNTDWWGHTGGILYQTFALYSPELDISVVMMTHDATMSGLDVAFFNLILTYLQFQPTAAGERFKEKEHFLVYPNPFNDEMVITADLKKASMVQMTVLNALGQMVDQSTVGHLNPGMNNFKLTGCRNWPPGIYQIQLQGEDWLTTESVMKR